MSVKIQCKGALHCKHHLLLQIQVNLAGKPSQTKVVFDNQAKDALCFQFLENLDSKLKLREVCNLYHIKIITHFLPTLIQTSLQTVRCLVGLTPSTTPAIFLRLRHGSVSPTYLCAAFTPVVPKSVGILSSCQYLLTLSGSMSVKAVRRMLMKSTPCFFKVL